jgi:hypothetical protein
MVADCKETFHWLHIFILLLNSSPCNICHMSLMLMQYEEQAVWGKRNIVLFIILLSREIVLEIF